MKNGNVIKSYSCSDYETWGIKECGHGRNGIAETKLIPHVESGLQMLAGDGFKVIKDYFKRYNAEKEREKEVLSILTLDSQIEEQTRLSLSLLSSFTDGILGKNQFKLQNEVIEEKLNSLMQQREILLLEQNKIVVNVDDEGNTIKAIKALLDVDSANWTNEMLKKVISKINIDMPNNDIEIQFSYNTSSN